MAEVRTKIKDPIPVQKRSRSDGESLLKSDVEVNMQQQITTLDWRIENAWIKAVGSIDDIWFHAKFARSVVDELALLRLLLGFSSAFGNGHD